MGLITPSRNNTRPTTGPKHARLTNSTRCPHTGKHCLAGLHLAQRLFAGIATAEGLTAPEFEISGTAEIDCHLPAPCRLVWHGTSQAAQVFCDVAQDMPLADLLDHARNTAQSGADPTRTQPSPEPPPCAAMLTLEPAAQPLELKRKPPPNFRGRRRSIPVMVEMPIPASVRCVRPP